MAVITNESKDSLENRTNVQLENSSQLELENQEQEIYFNFFNSLKSPVTKVTYDGHIKTYLKFCNFTKLSELLTIPDPQKQIIKYITSLKDRGLSYNSIHTMLYGIYHFYIMNDVIVNKEKINKFIGEPTLTILDKPYTHEQIKKILDVSDLRMKCIVLLMASGGLRVGAITSLKLRNLERIEQCYKITVYEGSKEQYITFVTPECSSFIDSYLEYRAKSGEKLTENSFLIRE